MTEDTLVLVGQEGAQDRGTLRTHADRLERRELIERAHVVMYGEEPTRELRERFETIDTERAFVLPACVAHSHDTVDAIPAALSFLDGAIHYCEPVGRCPALTDLLMERATKRSPVESTLVLVALGSSSLPHHREMAECHATRLHKRGAFTEIVTCYVLQNPAVECVRYNISTDRAVAIPLFLSRNETTDERIPTKLELHRGGLAYADPFGTDHRVTDALHAEVARQRVLADGASSPFGGSSAEHRYPVATDGEGAYR
jgi:sirohydrochlorin ferrochelatase